MIGPSAYAAEADIPNNARDNATMATFMGVSFLKELPVTPTHAHVVCALRHLTPPEVAAMPHPPGGSAPSCQ